MQIIINGTRGIRGREPSRHGGFLAVYTCIDEQQCVFGLPPASSNVLQKIKVFPPSHRTDEKVSCVAPFDIDVLE